jgi:uncharacterized protein YqhQ
MALKVKKKPKHMTRIGGQALIEGVMMRGPEEYGIAVRKPDGEIELKKRPVDNFTTKSRLFRLPFVRGVVSLIEAMVLGMKSLMYSAEFFEDEPESEAPKGKLESFLEKKLGDKFPDIAIYMAVAISIGLSVVVFMLIPTFITSLFKRWIDSSSVLNIIEGVIRVSIFLTYLFAVSKLDDIKRVFQYHGAEHKTIHCYENREELTVENVKKYPVLHPRCGTSFLFNVMIVSIVVFSFFGWPDPLMRFALRIALFPVIGGIAYEINRLIGKSESAFAYAMSYPGLMIQNYATTREPEDDQIEVAIEALKLVLVEDEEADKW